MSTKPKPRKARRVVLEKLAGQIVRTLFINGATRLAMKRRVAMTTGGLAEEDLGGWCEAAARDRILFVLRLWLPDPPKAKR